MKFSANETLFKAFKELNETYYTVCFDTPPHIVSDGLWGGQENGRIPSKSFFLVFELQILVIFAITQICRALIKPLALPLFISQMMAGLILVFTFEIEAMESYMKMLFPFGTHDIISTISSLGLVLYIFVNGVQMDMRMITRTGYKPWAISIIGLIFPLVLGVGLAALFVHKLEKGHEVDIFISVISNSLTSFPVVSSLLNELKIQNSEIGRLALSAAMVSDSLSVLVATVSVALKVSDPMNLAWNLVSLFSFLFIIPIVYRPFMFWIIKHTPEGRPVREGYLYMIISMIFVMGLISVKMNHEFILGAFILGLAVPEGPPLGSALVKKLSFFGKTFFLPIFVTTAMLRVEFGDMDYSSTMVVAISLAVVFTHFVKMVACFLTAMHCNMPAIDAFTLALLMNTKGVVEIGLFCSFYDSGIICSQTYTVVMISVMIISSIVKLSVKFLYDPSRKYAGYQKRNIISLRPDSDLRILVTIHKPNHIAPSVDFLDICHPTIEQSITVDALHLIELVGRSLPVFIPHALQRQTSSSTSTRSHRSYSDNVILAFDIFQHDNPNATLVYTYTAISPPSLMYENVCTLALDKVASMIVLPFHQRWSGDGVVESDDKYLRTLNRKVLETAPCTVGILVNRSTQLRKDPCNKLAIVYLGGTDDQEVLCLARRAIVNPKVTMTVYHLIVKNQVAELEELMEEEDEVLQEVKRAQNVSYEQVPVTDGADTAVFLRAIVNEHDFFIVGRRHGINSPQTMGLTNWSEFPELGVIGDFLSSPDFKSDASILVVQQQICGSNH